MRKLYHGGFCPKQEPPSARAKTYARHPHPGSTDWLPDSRDSAYWLHAWVSTMTDRRAAYQSLAADDRRILRALSVVCEPISQTSLGLLLDALGWKDRRGAPLKERLGKVWRERLLAGGLIEQKRNNLTCHPDLLEPLTRETLADGSFDLLVAAAEKLVPTAMRNAWDRPSEERRFRLFRLAVYRGREDDVLRLLLLRVGEPLAQVRYRQVETLAIICTRSADPAWLETLPARLKVLALAPMLREAALDLNAKPSSYQLMERLLAPLVPDYPDAADALAEQRLLRGQLSPVAELLTGREQPQALMLAGWRSMLQGAYPAAIEDFEAALQLERRRTRKRNLYVPGIPGILYLLALLQRGAPADLEQVRHQVAICLKASVTDLLEPVFRLLDDLAAVLAGEANVAESAWLLQSMAPRGPFPGLFQALCLYWLGKRPVGESLVALRHNAAEAARAGLDWYAREAVALLQRFGVEDALPALAEPPSGQRLLTDLLAPKPTWEIALEALKGLGEQRETGTDRVGQRQDADRRMAWLLTLYDSAIALLEPREQRRTKRGGWTQGRAVSLQRLAEEPERFPYLTQQDRAICDAIKQDQQAGWYGGYGRSSYQMDLDQALLAAIGHPLVFRPNAPEAPIELVRGAPALSVMRRDQDILVSLEPYPSQGRPLLPVQETPQRVRVILFDAGHLEIARILGPEGLVIPSTGEKALVDSLTAVAPMLTVHSDIGGGDSQAEAIQADVRPHLHLTPCDEGLRIDLFIHPFGEFGPQLRPGLGRASLFTEHEGQPLRCRRNLQAEREAAQAVIAACPALSLALDSAIDAGLGARLGLEPEAGEDWGDEQDWIWNLPDPAEALAALEQLHALGDQVQLDWPRGRRVALSKEIGLSRLQVKVRQKKDWFDVAGELQLDDGRVLAMRELVERVASAQGRYVRLGEGDFLVLSSALRRRLQGLASLVDDGRFHPLAAPAVHELIDGMQVEASQEWLALLDRLAQIEAFEPELPSTLQAELRDYQLEGFRWLARLAHWGAGACLADDMGLGKTIQALALILTRAPQGPTLVLAPTSVCGNWLDEAERFAPTLRPLRFGDGDRAAMLDAAGPFDLIVCSYGLLQTERERLSQVDWQTIVADEAQAFKNAMTKRSQAIMALKGDFRMITTGTPIENHLGELWNLFRFINPGLLGSLQRFNQRFAIPIEQDKDQGARQRLRQLLKPFILRRLKTDVLAELPPRTEINLQLELSAGEMALYEALRREAMERLDSEGSKAAPGHKRLLLLAEIMRLRRVCCHPRLALPDTELPSAKLEAFAEIVDELLDNRHKALVFSQFVDHLSLIREHLDRRQIRYQYLDGSTPEPQRRAAVDAFQAGEGDLFLISLRAGGAGLNLTAADYVIHMDPWWNPAVEDQASDRAHRIGQERPVTVYRLVAKDTIEERILKLHASKRDLADGLLSGADDGGKLSYEQMLALVQA
ncbi:MAG: DEAD/DEAH box helicase [Lamprobacter sp.]|uniref:DEAD/DEAH box helicase n=1 Tax=Lamprobacter sp. TaxID=3100796 RepID=UPI002B2615DA|nr:DEAD/DEAH box helicase [Lamprobacter sp.]MEA3638974.1 DEAD/DEAH box helicase [Lamprobacter sp.]